MGSSGSSSSSTTSATPNDPDRYLRNQMIRQRCLQTRSNNEPALSKPYFDNRDNPPPTQQLMKTHLGCDYQGNVVECDESGRVIRVVKPNNR